MRLPLAERMTDRAFKADTLEDISNLPADLFCRFRDRFWEKAVRAEGHLLWLSQTDKDGYGVFTVSKGRPRRAHRVAYALTHGSVPEGLLVRHTCDIPSCIEPEHLLAGTNADNTADAVARGRMAKGKRHGSKTQPEAWARGERNGHAKLGAAEVTEIKRRLRESCGRGGSRLAREFGVTPQLISLIKQGKAWAHVA